MSDENELLEPLATEAGQLAIARAINNLSSLEYAVRAERAATTATLKADEALNSATAASSSETMARNWATKTDGYVAQETITIPPEQEGDDPTTETIDLYSARYYAALAQDIYNNLQFDTEPTENSTNIVSSGAIYDALDLKADKSTTYTKTEVDTLISTAVSNLVDSAPSTLDTLEELADALGDDPNFATTIATQLGNKADKSDTYTKTEVDTALGNVQSTLTFDNVPTANSDNPVKSSGIKTALDGKQDALTFDSTPTANSTNPVTSGGVYTALQNVNIDIDDEITEDSDNPVTSAAIYEALLNFTPSGDGDNIIVSDARMTVKSGFLDLSSGVTRETRHDYNIIFDSPMPDVNYKIYTERVGWADYYNQLELTITNKTVNGFTISGFLLNGNIPATQGFGIDWIAIRPNSYTREGMVEDVLFSNASGFTTGTINLSGNISDYDLLEFILTYDSATDHNISRIVDSATFIANDKYNFEFTGNRYFVCTVPSDSSITCSTRSNIKITKIIGIKFGRYVSGVLIDNTITSSATGVPSTSAVYTALLNAGGGGGGGGSSITVDSTITENSTNPVESAALYNVLNPLLMLDFEDITNTSIKVNTANQLLCKVDGRGFYKRYADDAVSIVTEYMYHGSRWLCPILVSPTYNGAVAYSDYNTNASSTPSTLEYNGVTLYYSSPDYLFYDKAFSTISNNSVPVVERTFNSKLDAALYLCKLALLKENTLSTFYIKDAYTKSEVDAALLNVSGGTTYTAGNGIDITNDTISLETASANSIGGIKVGSGLSINSSGVLSATGDVTTNTDQNITGTKTFVGSKKVGFKLSAANDKLGFTLFGNTGTERGYLEFNPTNTVDGVTGLMTIGNYATTAAGLTQVGFRRYSNISGASGAYNLLMPMVADARTPFSLTTTYLNFYLPLGFTDGTTTVKTAKSGVVDLSPLLTAAINSITNANGVSY